MGGLSGNKEDQEQELRLMVVMEVMEVQQLLLLVEPVGLVGQALPLVSDILHLLCWLR